MARFVEDIPDENPKDLDMPDMQFAFTDTILIFDHIDHKIKVVSNSLVEKDDPGDAYDKACDKISGIIHKLKETIVDSEEMRKNTEASAGEILSNFTKGT